MENGPFMNELPIKMVVFHSYVSVPEGIILMLWLIYSQSNHKTFFSTFESS